MTFVRYIVVGCLALALHLSVLEALLWAHGRAWVASAAGFIMACAFNYTMQRLWVFQSRRSHGITLMYYCAITTVMLGANMVLFGTLLVLEITPFIAQILTTSCIFICNFYLNRRVTFAIHRTEAGAGT